MDFNLNWDLKDDIPHYRNKTFPTALSILIIFLFSFNTYCQSNKQEREIFAYNILSSGLTAGIGAILNKNENESVLKTFMRGTLHGSMGGLFIYTGKKITYNINKKKEILYSWPAHLTNSVGASIVENAASNKKFWENWHINFYLTRLDYNFKENQFKARLSTSLVYGLLNQINTGKLNISKSLRSGFIIFDRDLPYEGYLDGDAIASTISYGVDLEVYGEDEEYRLFAHEVVHSLQYESFTFMNSYFDKLNNSLKSESKLYNQLSRFLYFDLNGPYFLGVYYLLENGRNNPNYYENWFELEAEYFATNKIVQ